MLRSNEFFFPFLFFLILFIDGGVREGRKKNIFHLLVHSPNIHRSQYYIKLKVAAGTWSQSPMCVAGIQVLEPSPVAFQDAHQ